MEQISLKNKELEYIIIQIFNETYEDFINRYGEKHKEYIKKMLESISGKIQKKEMFQGALASAHVDMGVIYGKSDKLSAILKHELYHVFNESAFGTTTSYATLPSNYKEFLEKAGIIKKEYENKTKEYKKKWKDEPETLEYLIVDYDTFFKSFDLGDSEIEKWTEWFNARTNERDMKPHFLDLGNGFYMGSKSSSSFYDYYINICDMVSCLIPEDKLIEMHLNTEHHKTDYSFQEMISDFDNNYETSLDSDEKKKYGYPYLKILCDTKTIDENARKNDNVTLSTLQSCMRTCFRAYLCKMNNVNEINEENIKTIFNEIKKMQQYMVWNVDTKKMEELPYIQEMINVQEKFKEMCKSLSKNNSNIEQMLERVDYRSENPFQKIENGEAIANGLFINDNQDLKERQYGEYKVKTDENGIKTNMYKNIKVMFGDKIFELLFKRYNSKEDNELSKLYEMIQNVDEDNTNSVKEVYNYIYSLYINKMNSMLKTDENSSTEFEKCYNTIKKMQELSLVRLEDGKYIGSFESVLELYKEKIGEYEKYIECVTKQEIKIDFERTNNDSTSFRNKLALSEKNKLNGYLSDIEQVRQENINNAKERITPTIVKIGTQTAGLHEINSIGQEIRDTYNSKYAEKAELKE
ncbi:MAG: hypothetical protein Q4G09_02780 [Clostridia bacterium]|nr:hypothetical protein [Clostridia bacterium]